MGAWPSIQAPAEEYFAEWMEKGQVRTEFENGVVQSRARATSERMVFKLGWKGLSNTDWGSIKTHFAANIGGTFSWTHPISSTSYTVRYRDDRLPEARPNGYTGGSTAWDIQGLILEEA